MIVAGILWLQVTCYSSGMVGRVWYRRTLAENAATNPKSIENRDDGLSENPKNMLDKVPD